MPVRVKIRAVFIAIMSISFLGFLFYRVSSGSLYKILLLLYLLLGFLLIYLFLPRVRMPGEIQRGKRGKVYLTFDDGPLEPHTSKILDLLREENVKAAFFVVGERVRRYPYLVKRAFEEGHLIGNHTHTHRKFPFLFYGEVREEIERCEEAVYEAAGVKPVFLRTPHGFRSPFLPFITKKKKLKVVTWTKGVWDTDAPGEEIIVKRVFQKVRDGEILLLHDGNEKSSHQTANALREIIRGYRERGYEFGSLNEI